MSTAPQYAPISVDNYLSGENQARRKHEYVEGFIYAMAGATNAHNRIATNGTVELGSQLRGNTCQVFNSDTKVRKRLAQGTRFYYPDAMVVCQVNPPQDSFQDQPVVIIEVLSKGTRRTDENEKRDVYLSFDSLCVYLLVEQAEVGVTVYRRGSDRFETERYAEITDIIPLPEIDCQLKLSELYENVEFISPTPEEED